MFVYISVSMYICNKYISECIPLFDFLIGAKVTVALNQIDALDYIFIHKYFFIKCCLS